MKKIGFAWLPIAILVLALKSPFAYAQQSAAATAQPANIVFVDAAAVTLTPDSAGAFELETPVKNTGGAAGTPAFRLRGLDSAKCNEGNKDLIPGPAIDSLDPNAIAIAHFTITGVPLPAVCHIELETKVKDTVANKDTVVNTSLKQVKLSQQYATCDVLRALLACLVLSGAMMAVVRLTVKLPKDFRIGMPAWEFAKSWSSNLTLASAILTATLALSALPELTKYASKAGYAILAVFIAAVVVVAPLVFVAFRRGSVQKDEQTNKASVVYSGGSATFFLSCAITLFAGLAQLLVLYLLGEEIFRNYGVWSALLLVHEPRSIGLGSGLTAVAAAMLCAYTVLSMQLTIDFQVGEKAAMTSPTAPAAEAERLESKAAAANVKAREALARLVAASESAAIANAEDKETRKADADKAAIDANIALADAESAAAESIAAHRRMLTPGARAVLAEMVKSPGGQALPLPRQAPRSWPML